MAQTMEQFVNDGMDVVEFRLVRDREDIADETTIFRPEMCHQIFGEEEKIFGYRDLKVSIFYSAGPLDIYLNTTYSKKVDDLKIDLKADDITAAVSHCFPEGCCFYTNLEEYLSKLDERNASFRPMGELIKEFSVSVEDETRTFEIYHCTMNTPGLLKYHARLESFVFWFVDAASRIIHDNQWEYFLIFEKYKAKDTDEFRWASVGYSTVYLFYAYPEHRRGRISQLLVLPPFQRLGVGTQLIEAFYDFYGPQSQITDLTVEEPSPIFQHMRSCVDARLCRSLPAFAPEKLKVGLSKEMLQEAKEKLKINPKQCRIVYEILRLSAIDRTDQETLKAYRVEIKKRLNVNYHKQRRDLKKAEKAGVNVTAALALLPTEDERREQLQEEFRVIYEDYLNILKKIGAI